MMQVGLAFGALLARILVDFGAQLGTSWNQVGLSWRSYAVLSYLILPDLTLPYLVLSYLGYLGYLGPNPRPSATLLWTRYPR